MGSKNSSIEIITTFDQVISIMSIMQIFTRELEQKQDKRLAHGLALKLAIFLDSPKGDEKEIVDAINDALTKSYNKDKEFAQDVIAELNMLYPEINKKHPFKLKE